MTRLADYGPHDLATAYRAEGERLIDDGPPHHYTPYDERPQMTPEQDARSRACWGLPPADEDGKDAA